MVHSQLQPGTLGLTLPVFTGVILSFALGSGCTGQLPGSFRLAQQQENFAASQSINTKIDMLWVVDNSGSMEPMQAKVRAGIQQFAQQYMKPTWNIRVAAITTDAFLADPTFWQGPANQTSYLTTVRAGTANSQPNYLNGAAQTYGSSTVPARSHHYYDQTSWTSSAEFPLFSFFQPNPYQPPSITYNSGGGIEKFQASGLRIIDTKPQLGPNWAKLLVGNHDGPQLSMCWDGDESSSQFIYGVTACYHRDDRSDPQHHIGPDACANPNTGNGETGTSQCVNTFANNSVHTGLPYISTIPPAGTPGDQNWINKLISDFQVQLTPSTVGNGSERPFQSVLQFLKDNEADPSTRFFRPGSLRVIVFVGDEDDQSQLPDPNQYSYGTVQAYGGGSPGAYTLGGGTKAHFVPENASAPFICKQVFTGANPGTYFPTADSGFCVDPAWLIPVSTVKQGLDAFFQQLDGVPASGSTNYFVATITTMNPPAAGYNYVAVRYPALANAVGNGSLILDLGLPDYSPLLNQVGLNILKAKAVFQLKRAPTGQEEMVLSIQHADGSTSVVNASQFTVADKTLTITDLALVGSFTDSDQVSVNYQPKTLY